MSDWKSELKKIAENVTEYIRTDGFPSRIEPEPLRDAVRAYPLAGGKRIRPALLLWSCGMFGGDPAQALPAAAALEIYHNWTLVHDDIIDCDEFRRGIPTTHTALRRHAEEHFHADAAEAAKFGTDFAILAGDLQQSWAIRAMLRLKENGVAPGIVLFLTEHMQDFLARRLISGEALDVAFEHRGFRTVDEEQVIRMIDGKTGAILRFAMLCGGVIARGIPDFEREEFRLASAFAGHLALAFQLRDDWLGVFGSVKKFGKPLASDFQEAKPTLLYLAAMRRASAQDREKLAAFMGRPSFSPEDLDELRRLLDDCGAAGEIQNRIRAGSDEALAALRKLPDNRFRSCLESLTNELTDRMV